MMTLRELRDYCEEKRRLTEAIRTLDGLRIYQNQVREQLPGTEEGAVAEESVERAIAELEVDVERMSNSLSVSAEDIRDTLSAVSDTYDRTALMLHYHDGLSWQSVSEITGATEASIKKRTQRALKRVGIT